MLKAKRKAEGKDHPVHGHCTPAEFLHPRGLALPFTEPSLHVLCVCTLLQLLVGQRSEGGGDPTPTWVLPSSLAQKGVSFRVWALKIPSQC